MRFGGVVYNAKKVFGKNVRKQRLQKGYSLKELSLLTGLHYNYISDVERCVRNVSITSMDKISKALDIEVSDLLKDLE